MRHFISIITLILIISTTSVMAQKNYAGEWQKVDTLEAKGLPQSALKIVNGIYARAVKDKQEAEQLKALIYQLKYREATGDSATLLNLQEVDKQIAAAKGPTKAVLQSIKAEMLQRYLNNHRYQLYSRTTVADDVSTDITTWTLARLQQEISVAYEASIANARELQSVPVEQYSPILVAGKNTRQLRPTLFDLLAYRALDWFKSGESNNNPANQFELADDAAFAPAAVFAKHDFKTTDSASLQYKALLLLQELLRFHANNKAALLDADLERITYMNQIGVMANKEELYARALQQMQQFYAGEKEVSRVIYLLAQVYWQRGNGDQDRIGLADKSENWIAQAKALCEIGIKLVPSSGAAQCQELLNGITLKRLDLSSEQVNLPGMPFRTLVTYKNINKVYLRVIRMDEAFRKTLRTAQNDYRDNQKSYWKLLRDRKPETSWEQTLPDPKDYVSHGAEIKIDALPLGQYLILASVSPDFSLDNNPLAVQLVYVSELSYINKNNAYYVLHRQSGQPLEGVKLNVWTVVDDNNGSLRLLQTAVSDKQGAVNIKPVDKNVNVRLEWTNKGDVLFLDNYKYLFVNRPVKEPAPQPRTFLFTDRSIYRPGQTLYFKGIVINKQGKDDAQQVKPDYRTTVYLYDQNGTVVDSMAVQTNEFGAYNGKFILPQGRMNGQFRLEGKAENGQAYFSVEEYKRPKFFVEFEPLKGTYRVGDSVTITGKAMAYAGSTIDGAQVKYRVQRQARFPYPWLMRGGGMWGSSNREITQGVTQTDAAGNFTITFPALPDKSVKADAKPIFTYTVYADVTDLNGESQSASKYVEAGYQALQLLVALPERVQQKELDSMRIVTQNMNGIFEPATVSIQIKALQAPDRLIRTRYWEEPDQFIFTKAEYVKLFPVDVYKNENLPANWEPKATIWQQDATTQADGKVAAGKQKLAAGWYELQVTTKDKFGAIVQEKKVFELVDINAKQLGYPAFEWTYATPQSYEPGDKVKLLLGTGANNLHVMQTLQRSEASETTSFIDMPAGIRDVPYTVKESDRGGLAMNFVFVKDSRVYNVEQLIAVPWSNKELDIKIAAHRDKLLPGEKEKWSMQISGYKGTKVAAEMLAGMYDASLDAFRPHSWNISGLYPTFYGSANWGGGDNFGMVNAAVLYNRDYNNITPWPFEYDQLNWFNWDMSGGGRLLVRGGKMMIRGATGVHNSNPDVMRETNAVATLSSKQKSALYGSRAMESDMAAPPPAAATLKEESAVGAGAPVTTPPMENITPRKNFQETAFFYPDLRTDKDGNISFEFTVPEALTRWKFMSIANTKDMAVGTAETTIVTQKPLMVQPNAPRFVREGDNMEFTAKISNLADSTLIGQARLELLDAATMQPVDGWFRNMFPVQHFTVQKGQSTAVSFPIQIPNNFQSVLLYRVVAQAGNFSDGEENAIPVLTNSMLVTEAMPMAVRGDGTHSFKMEKLLHSDTSQTLQQRGITVEFTSKPVWYAVQALPYLMEYPYQCAEQVFNRFYANALAAHIVKVTPGIKAIFKKWKTTDTAALISSLAKNEELKAVLLQETPWVMAAKNETEQKQRLALLFNLQKMQSEGEAAMQQLKDKQLPSGAFPWFTGMWEDRYITQYIMAGVGRLMQLEVTTGIDEEMVNKAIAYLDAQLDKDYYNLLHQKADMKKQQISQLQIHYLYMRSFFKDKMIPVKIKPAYDYYLSQAAKYWVSQGKYEQGMIALALYRKGDYATPANIVKSLKENAIHSPEMGMYWKNNQAGYYWYQAPIETQALMIEVFNTVTKDPDAVSDLKTWLLKNKQTNNWHTTKATADACYAMLLGSSKWLDADPQVTIRLGEETISNTTQATEAGSGYFQQYFDAKEVKPAMGNVTVTMKQSEGQPAWGAVYWQYFEQLDKITAAKTPLVLEKQLFIEKNTDKGPVLTKIADGNQLKVGDKVKVQVVLRTDRAMEYVHLRDMRAACFEPTNVISQSKWQNGLSYYESTKDASTDFFFSYLPKGTYVFEYTMFVTHQGNFSNGISTAQCMYAPEFSAHSEGIRVKVVE